MEIINYNSNNLINNNENNLQEDINIRQLQQNLIMMGFDITMINKIILYFKIRTENEAIDYLIKNEEGMWNHPFIPKEVINEPNNNNILEQPKIVMNNVLSRIKSGEILPNSLNKKSSIKENEINEYKIEDNICEICGELKAFHKIKEYNINNKINISDNLFDNNNNLINFNDDNNIILNNENKNKKNDNKKDILIDDEEDQKEEEINQNECPICMGEFENPVEIENCKHKFCYECFNSYLVNLINNNNIDKIPCPNANCSNKELSEEFFSQFLSEQQYFKYRQFKSKNEIARDPKKFFCPHCDSYAQIQGEIEKYDSNNPLYQKSVLKCNNGHEFCSCGRPLHENECFHDEKEFKELVEIEKMKKCPKCGFLIKKIRGCNHMTCGNPICKYEFCWLCMKEAVPNHYDYGPCAGRQFYDPDSFAAWLEQNFPCLYFIYNCLFYLFSFISFTVCFVLIPGIGLLFSSYILLFETNTFDDFIEDGLIKIFTFMNCSCLCFCFQSIIYISWVLFFFISSIVLFIGFISVVYYFCCQRRVFIPDADSDGDFDVDGIELVHRIVGMGHNENNNNNSNNNSNNENNNENV